MVRNGDGLRNVEPDVGGPAGELRHLGAWPVNGRERSQAYANRRTIWLLTHGLVDVQWC